jgi:hypothetical protein
MPRAEDPCPEGFFTLELHLKKWGFSKISERTRAGYKGKEKEKAQKIVQSGTIFVSPVFDGSKEGQAHRACSGLTLSRVKGPGSVSFDGGLEWLRTG